MKSHWVENKGKRVFIADFSNFRDNGAGVRVEYQAIIGELEAEPAHSVLALSNVEGTFANEDIMKALVDLVPITNKWVRRRALVGMTGFRCHFLYAFSKVIGDVNFTFSTRLLKHWAGLSKTKNFIEDGGAFRPAFLFSGDCPHIYFV